MIDNTENNSFLSNLSLEKKIFHRKEINDMTLRLKNSLTDKQASKKLNLSLPNVRLSSDSKKKSFAVVYIIHFSFSPVNTFLYITDSSGNLKVRYSAGSMEFKGKQKKSRLQILNSFFKELRKFKMTLLKNKPIALNLSNVGFYKYLIVKNLKKVFFLRFIKSYQTHAYNGCRKKKRLRKR